MEEKNSWEQFKAFLKDKFNLDEDKADQTEVVDNIRKGVEFKGTNLWILIFATVIASVGLNVNSTAVIIGAMLISPLMGPIMGIGMSLGINDFELMKKSSKNFIFSVLVSLVASTLYFSITPLSYAQSELLARTTPTTWDVLIATFGGLAGIVAASRRDRTSTVIPGVAIATALMPPLCTAGFGLATGNMNYFFGAFYLFFINAVFIAFATFFIVRFMKYQKKQQLDPKRGKQVKQYMIIILTATIVPSVIMAYSIVQRTIFETSAQKFVQTALKFEKTEIINTNFFFDRDSGNRIEIVTIGAEISQDVILSAESQLPIYGLKHTRLVVRQASGNDQIDNPSLQHLLVTNTDMMLDKTKQINNLQTQLRYYTTDTIPSRNIARELNTLQSGITNISLSRTTVMSPNGIGTNKVLLCIIYMQPGATVDQNRETKLKEWLSVRTKTPHVELIINHTTVLDQDKPQP